MDTVRRCAVCHDTVGSSVIFCSDRCQQLGKVIRATQAQHDEVHVLAEEPDVQITNDNPLSAQLRQASMAHRDHVTVVLAAYARVEMELDAVIWAAHTHGFTPRQIGSELEMRTSSVRRRILNFQARLHGPAPAAVAAV